jgi:uncharacterized protein YcfL
MRKILLFAVLTLSLAGCGAPPPNQASVSAQSSVIPSHSNTVHLAFPAGDTIKCTAYAGAVCPTID